MKRSVLFVTALLSVLTMAGAAYADGSLPATETENSIHQKIHEGQTTAANVRALFGKPDLQYALADGSEVWIYGHAEKHWDAMSYIPIIHLFRATATGSENVIKIVIDPNKIVEKMTWKTHTFVYKGSATDFFTNNEKKDISWIDG